MVNVKNNLFVDPTETGIIKQRFLITLLNVCDQVNLTDDERKKVENLLILIAKKLAITWQHYNQFTKHQGFLEENVKKEELIGDSNEQKINYSQDLFFEFDGFLVQLKSTLDYLVKIPSFILENRIWTLRTFGNKGEDVVSFLSNNMPKQYRGMATLIIEHIIKHHLGWLKHTIAARDKINHFIDEGVSYEHFYVQKINQEGIDKIHVPLWTESMTVQEFMHNIWMDLFSLSEQFVAAFLAIRVKPGSNLVHYKSVAYSTDSPLIVLNNEQLEEKRKEIDAMGGIILSDLNQVVEKKAEERRQRGEQNKKEVEIRRVQQPKRGKVNRGS